jgi:hypothetical protein
MLEDRFMSREQFRECKVDSRRQSELHTRRALT